MNELSLYSKEDLRKLLKGNFPYKEMPQEELDQAIIDNFGKDKLDELNVLANLDKLNLKLCDYLGLEPMYKNR